MKKLPCKKCGHPITVSESTFAVEHTDCEASGAVVLLPSERLTREEESAIIELDGLVEKLERSKVEPPAPLVGDELYFARGELFRGLEKHWPLLRACIARLQ